MKMDIVIFSKNRAMQLHALLETVYEHLIFDTIRVVYDAFQHPHTTSYTKIAEEFPHVKFIGESNFKQDVLRAIDSGESGLTCLMVDDMMFYRTPTGLCESGHTICHSFRLGEEIKGFTGTEFYWPEGYKHFGYPLATDGHVYNSRRLYEMLSEIQFQNPNKMEVRLQRFKSRIPRHMTCEQHSCCVSIPVNAVSDNCVPVFGEYYPQNVDQLAKMYNEGKRIDWRRMDFTEIDNVHKEIEFKYVDRLEYCSKALP